MVLPLWGMLDPANMPIILVGLLIFYLMILILSVKGGRNYNFKQQCFEFKLDFLLFWITGYSGVQYFYTSDSDVYIIKQVVVGFLYMLIGVWLVFNYVQYTLN